MNGYNFFTVVDEPGQPCPTLQAFQAEEELPRSLGWRTYDDARLGTYRYLCERQHLLCAQNALAQFEELYEWRGGPTEALMAHHEALAWHIRRGVASGEDSNYNAGPLGLSLVRVGPLLRIKLSNIRPGLRLAFLPRDLALFNEVLESAGVAPSTRKGWQAANAFELEELI